MKDPVTHVLLFKAIMAPPNMPRDKRDTMLCKSFASLLQFDEQRFSNLKSDNITSFFELV